MRPCTKCGGTDFRERVGKKRGKLHAWNECKPCTRSRQRRSPKPKRVPRVTPPSARPGFDGGLGGYGSPHIDPWLAWEIDDAAENWT